MGTLRILKTEQQYSRLFGAGLISGIGDRFSQVAVLGLLLTLTGSGSSVGIAFGIRLIPYLLFGPLGGTLADRFPRKVILIATDLVRVPIALMPLLVRDSSHIWLVYVSLLLLSAGEALYASSRMSSLPQIVRPQNLLAVNSMEQAMIGIVLMGGSAVGGFVIAMAGVQIAFLLNALSFLISALLLLPIRISQPLLTEAQQASSKPRSSSMDSADELKALLRGSSFIRAMLVVFALWPVGTGIFNILLSVYAVNVFHMGDVGIGLLYGSLGAGMLLGSGWTERAACHMKTVAVWALLMEGVLNMVISQTGYFVVAAALLALTAGIGAIGNACNRTILMHAVPKHFQGRFFGYLATLQNTVMGITMFLAGLSLEWISPRGLGLAGGGFLTLAGTVFLIFFFLSKEIVGSERRFF